MRLILARSLPRRAMLWVRIGVVVLAGMSSTAASQQPARITVFAAASLTDVLQEVSRNFSFETGIEVRHSFAASSTLARQIENGARAEVLLLADELWMDYLQQRNLLDVKSRRNLLSNRLVLIRPASEAVANGTQPQRLGAERLIATGADLEPLLAPLQDRRSRLTLADPASVPLGRYSQAALESLGLWQRVRAQMATADNARTALALVARGESPLGIVYLTDVLSERRVSAIGLFAARLHPPIVYPVAATRYATPAAKRYLDFLGGPDAERIFLAHGFTIPDQRAAVGP